MNRFFILNEEIQSEIDVMEETIDNLLYLKNHYDDIDYQAELLEQQMINIVDYQGFELNEFESLENFAADKFLDYLANGKPISVLLPGLTGERGLNNLFSHEPEKMIMSFVKSIVKLENFTTENFINMIDQKLHELGFDSEEQEVAIKLTKQVIDRIKLFNKNTTIISAIKFKQAIKKIFKKAKDEIYFIHNPIKKQKRLQTLKILIIVLNIAVYIFKQRQKVKKLIMDGLKTHVKV